MIQYQQSVFRRQQGVTVLAIVIAIAVLIGIVAVAIGTGTLLSVQSTERQGKGAIALAAAETGARDALLRIARNRNFECNSTTCTIGLNCDVGEGANTGYDVDDAASTLGGATVCVKVTKTTATCPGPGHQATILAVATIDTIKPKLQALVTVGCSGDTTIQEWKVQTS